MSAELSIEDPSSVASEGAPGKNGGWHGPPDLVVKPCRLQEADCRGYGERNRREPPQSCGDQELLAGAARKLEWVRPQYVGGVLIHAARFLGRFFVGRCAALS